ncbi:MAG TPA: SH3 domain-containing protein [Roseomonas sp.]
MGRIGADDGADACRSQLVQLDSTGNFFGEDIIRGAAIGAAGGAILGGVIAAARGGSGRNIATGAGIGALAGGAAGAATGYFAARQRQAQDQAQLNQSIASDVSAENASIDRTQRAFDLLMDCRFQTAQRIRQDFAAHRLERPQAQAMLADVRTRVQRDVQLARTINERIGARGAEFDTAFDTVAPSAKAQAGARVGRTVPVTTPRAVALRLRPDSGAPEVGQISARQRVTVRPAHSGYALVETDTGLRGYAPANAFPGAAGMAQARRASPNDAPETGDVRQLAATNIARRDNFNESVATADRLASGSGGGFELAS